MAVPPGRQSCCSTTADPPRRLVASWRTLGATHQMRLGATPENTFTDSDKAEVAGLCRASPTKKLMSAYSLAWSPTTVTKDQGTKGRRRRTADQVRPAFVECHRIPAGP
jgi:uncharacterized protein YndB with AHSA1/START domain